MFFHTAPAENFQFTSLPLSGNAEIFGGIGRLRVPTADADPGIVIISVLFEYNPADRPFSEELALRIGEFRTIIRDYIGSFSAAELRQLNEEIIRSELLLRFNTILRLGRIETLFFGDFMIIG